MPRPVSVPVSDAVGVADGVADVQPVELIGVFSVAAATVGAVVSRYVNVAPDIDKTSAAKFGYP
jgi:hypothetical protein